VVVIPIMVMIVFVPIAICVPAVSVFIPPFVDVVPAIFASLVELMPRIACLAAVPPMMLNSFVDLVICPSESMLAGVIVGRRSRRSAQQQEPSRCHRGQCCSYKPLTASRQNFLHIGIPPESAQDKGWRGASQYRLISSPKKEQSTGPKSRALSIFGNILAEAAL
jgi:hypothetical protein